MLEIEADSEEESTRKGLVRRLYWESDGYDMEIVEE